MSFLPSGRLAFAHSFGYGQGTEVAGGGVAMGIHFAASDDLGATWVVNTYLGPASVPGEQALGADRPWIVPGPNGVVYLTYAGFLAGVNAGLSQTSSATSACDARLGIMVQRSDNGGATWTSPVTAVKDGSYCWHLGEPPDGYTGFGTGGSANGQIAVDAEGRVFVSAYVGNRAYLCVVNVCQQPPGTPDQFVVAISEDGGETFVSHEVWNSNSYNIGGWASSVAVDAFGTVFAAGRSREGAVLVARSFDHGVTWEPPIRWNGPEDVADYGIRAVAGPEGLDVAWYGHEADGKYRLEVGRIRTGPGSNQTPQVIDLSLPILQGYGGRGSNTDFAFINHRPDGRLAAVWSDAAEKKLFVVLEEVSS